MHIQRRPHVTYRKPMMGLEPQPAQVVPGWASAAVTALVRELVTFVAGWGMATKGWCWCLDAASHTHCRKHNAATGQERRREGHVRMHSY